MISPYFLLDFINKQEKISSHCFRIELHSYKPNKTVQYEKIYSSDHFKNREEYSLYLSENDITDIESRYVHTFQNYSNPIGTLLFDFLDADLSNTRYIKKLTLKYGSSALKQLSGNNYFEDELNYENNNESQFDESLNIDFFENALSNHSQMLLEDYQILQKDLKEIINFVYNIEEKSYLKGLTPSQRYYIYIRTCRLHRETYILTYLNDVSMTQDLNFAEFSNSLNGITDKTPEGLAKAIKKMDKKNHNYYIKTYFYNFTSLCSAYYFCLLYFIENNIPIKICKNCGKYFIPENRNSSIYCNRIYKVKRTCKEIGANNAYNEKLKKDEVNALYRKTLSAKKMLANRNPDILMYLEKYEKWKNEANKFKQDIKEGKKTEEEFKNWIEKTKRNY